MNLDKRLARLEGKAGTGAHLGPSIIVIQAVTKSGEPGEDMTLSQNFETGEK